LKETRGPVILARRAKMAGKAHNENAHITPQGPSISPAQFLYDTIVLPAYLLCTEPVVFFFTLLSALSYGIVFISTQSVTQVYMTNYNWQEDKAGLVQAAVVIGEAIGFLACVFQNHIYSRFAGKTGENSESTVAEVRLYSSIPASFLGLAGGLFWYGWTSYASLPWVLPSIGLGLTGFGVMVVMQAIMMYVTDSYAKYAASASAAVCFGENIFAAFLPLAAQSMYTNLGFRWASSVLAFVVFLLSFAPIILVLKGKEVRRRSPFMRQAMYE
jgi:hypothetical protein